MAPKYRSNVVDINLTSEPDTWAVSSQPDDFLGMGFLTVKLGHRRINIAMGLVPELQQIATILNTIGYCINVRPRRGGIDA